jgi:hypothetical protein
MPAHGLADPVTRVGGADDVIETFEVAKDGDFLLVPVTMEGKTYELAIDTGSTGTILDTGFAARLTKLTKTVTMNSKTKHQLYVLPSIARVGKSALPLGREAVCADLGPIRVASGYDIRGVIGMDFLGQYVVRIDFDAGRLSLLRPNGARRAGGLTLARDRMNRPTVTADFRTGAAYPFLIDTANVGPISVTVTRQIYDKLVGHEDDFMPGPSGTNIALEGAETCRAGLVRRFRFGGFEHGNLALTDGDFNSIGLYYLSRFVVTLDFPNGVMYLEKGRQFLKRQQFDTAGMRLRRADRRIIVADVSPGEPAQVAGVHVGDCLVSVDGRDAKEFTLFELGNVFSADGGEVHLVVEDDTGRRTVKLALAAAELPEDDEPDSGAVDADSLGHERNN